MLEESHIKAVIKDTILEVQADSRIQIAKPKTLQGWLGLGFMVCSIIAGAWAGVSYLSRMADHHLEPYHHGTLEAVERIEQTIADHANNEQLHLREAELKLKILEETTPMKKDINQIQQDVGSIKTKIDILIDRKERGQ